MSFEGSGIAPLGKAYCDLPVTVVITAKDRLPFPLPLFAGNDRLPHW